MTDSGSTEAQILEQARRLFNQQGYKGMTLRSIAQAVGIEAQSIYNYTPSKQALVDRMMRTAMGRLHGRVATAIALAEPDPASRLRAAVHAHTDYFCTQDDFFMVVRDALEFLEPEVRTTQLRVLRSYENLFKEIIRDGVASGDFEVADTTSVAYAVMGLGESIVHWYKPGGRLSAQQVADEYADLALRMVRSRPAAPTA
jgi:TetR/AcrR family transcriptional regulator, cholesterol catabolism regulator